MVSVDNATLMSLDGSFGDGRQAHMLRIGEDSWEAVPKMTEERYASSCGVIAKASGTNRHI